MGALIRNGWTAESLIRDARYGLRGLRRSPGFTCAVVLTLAIGIGGNTAIFSVIDQLLLRPLPYPDGDQLVMLYESRSSGNRNVVSPGNWLDWQRQSRTITGMAAWMPASATMTGNGEPERLVGQGVSFEFFRVLGVKPLLGRALSAEDDRPDAPPVVVISHELWERRFGRDAGVIGRSLRLDDVPAQIVGVMPREFRFVFSDAQYWSALRLPREIDWREAAGRFMNVVGRIKPGGSLEAASGEMAAIARNLAALHAFNTRQPFVLVVPLREALTGQVQSSVLVLYGAVGVLLAIACFNVANLLLARMASRRREIVIRTALGAGRAAIVRQLLVESVLLAMIGGLLGGVLARWSLDALLAFAPADLLRVSELTVDRRVLLYALGLSLATGLGVGLAPAVTLARRSLSTRIRESAGTVTQSLRLRQALVVCQVVMTVILLCGSGLLLRTVIALNRTNSGFDQHGLVSMTVSLPVARYAPDRRVAFFTQAVDALRALPSVEFAGAGNSIPVVGGPRGGTSFQRLGAPEVPRSERPSTTVRVVTPGYFKTLRIPVIRGREFVESDQAPGATPGFIVNEAFARRFLSDIDPLTASLSVSMQRPENPYRPVIGVVGDVSEGSIRDEAKPTVFYSHAHLTEQAMTIFVRTSQTAAISRRSVEVLHSLDPNLAVTNVRTVDSAFTESVARERLNAMVSGTFALSGLLLAALGLYALLAYFVTERTKEIGIRIALGAQRSRVIRSVVGGGIRLVGIGAVTGVAGALLLSRSLEPLLFGVEPHDPLTYVSVLVLLGVVAAWASYVPARRAATVQPLLALRHE